MVKQGRFPHGSRVLGALVAVLTFGAPAVPVLLPAVASASTVSAEAPAKQKRSSARARRAAARARTLREAQTPRFRIDDLGREVPDVRAAAAIIYNPETNEILWESNAQAPRSIASITKVMTALVAFESGVDLSVPVSIVRSDVARASVTYLRAGYKVSTDSLLQLMLIGSDNGAARAVARSSPYGAAGFIDRMNQKAAELGLESTRYADPSGLLAENVSSAYDMARLIAYAASDDRIGEIMRTPQRQVDLGPRVVTVRSTNQLVKTGEIDVRGGKTGFIRVAGYCLATLLRLPQTGQQVAVVVLGAPSGMNRFWETRHLFNWLSGKTPALAAAAAVASGPQPQPED